MTTKHSVHTLNKYLLSAYYVPGTAVCVEIRTMDKPSVHGKKQDDSIIRMRKEWAYEET